MITTLKSWAKIGPKDSSSSISGNVEQVSEVEELVSLFRHQTLEFPKLTLLHKILKAARLAMIDCVVLNRT